MPVHSESDRTVVDQQVAQREWSPLARLISELQQGWQAGGSPRVEPIFQKHPELFDHPEAGLRLIYEEICQRRAQGENVSAGELYNRFPQWHAQLQGLVTKSEADTVIVSNAEDDFFDAFDLLHELGRGSGGRVYLARQKRLGNRLVVLKVTRFEDMEHLSLARLQHTNIVPLYGVFDDPRGRRRALCMPYFGSTTLFHVFTALESIPILKRRGDDIVDALERRERELPESGLQTDLARQTWGKMDYVEATCRIGAALADALGDAHRRGLLHLDIKPSNVLLSADGLPMLLDFHLARAPLVKGEPPPHFFGGSPPFMAPEQKSACDDVMAVHPIRVDVDTRSEIYSLGMLLVVGLAGEAPEPNVDPTTHLRAKNPLVSVGLADILGKCLKADPAERYQTSNHLAEDLRRHVQNLPLAHVANRSLAERWSKWRRRSPMMLPIIMMAGVMALAVTAGLLSLNRQFTSQLESADAIYVQGQVHLNEKKYREAADAFAMAKEQLPALWADDTLGRAIDRDYALAKRLGLRMQLRELVDDTRHLLLAEKISYRGEISIVYNARKFWDERAALLETRGLATDNRSDLSIRKDLTELALTWADFHMRLAPKGREQEYREECRRVLEEARQISPSAQVIDWALATLEGQGAKLPTTVEVADADPWEYFLLGWFRMRRGEFEEAFSALDRSVHGQPADFWGNLSLGMCALQLNRPEAAVAAFSVCIGHEPQRDDVLYFRLGQAHAQRKEWRAALRYFDRTVERKPSFPHGQVYLERGKVHLQLDDLESAQADFVRARDRGVDLVILEPFLKKLEK